VRIAVHTGEAKRRDHGYLGETLNRCARIRATGHGGQVLVSAATAGLVADRLPARAALVDLGQHRLKDLGRSEHIWQLVHPDLPSSFPALRSLDLFHHNLPTQLTSLIGRGGEISDVRRLVEGERLVTLTGSAGVGKTRLALAVAAETLESHPGGVWWVELAPLADPSAVGRAALAALGAGDMPGATAAQQLAVELGDERSLLVLDNCEHLVTGCAELVAELLVANPSTSVLTTSREPLGVPGEITWRVPSLRCPGVDTTVAIPSLSQYDAVVLFVERAHRARPSFAVTDANAPAIAQICHRLDGIPLAIELAAARCRQMTAERIATELDNRFRLLTGGARTVMARQQTLAASVDWSHERLDQGELLVFRRLSVFAGPFPLEAAEGVVASPGELEPAEVFDILSRLVDKSLVVADDGTDGEPRYRLLETLRAYALERARAANELTLLRDAHAEWWTDWLEPSYPIPTDDMLARVEEFYDNLRVALDWSTAAPAVGLRLWRSLATVWLELGWSGEGALAAERLLTRENAEEHPQAWLDAVSESSDVITGTQGRREWYELASLAQRVAGELGDDYRQAIARFVTNVDQLEEATAVRELAEQRGDGYWKTVAAIQIAWQIAEDDPAAANPLIAEADDLVRASGSRRFHDEMLLARASAARTEGDLPTCVELGRRLLQGGRSYSRTQAVHMLSYAALLALDEEALREAADAGEHLERKAAGFARYAYNARHRLELFEGQPSVVHPFADTSDFVVSFATTWLACREALDAGETEAALSMERTWNRTAAPHGEAVLAAVEAAARSDQDRWHDALVLALDHNLRLIAVDALEGLAIAASRDESWAESLRLIGAADRLRSETGYQWRFPFEQSAVDAARIAAFDALGDSAGAADHEGHNLDWRDAAAYARRARGERKRPHHGWASLTPTEHQVVELVAEGMTNPEIAQRLLMGRATVKTHLTRVFAKLGVRTRAELAAEATRRAQT
jgi:predicted ATPase/DNA-binding CsgD family transcriptional regulator